MVPRWFWLIAAVSIAFGIAMGIWMSTWEPLGDCISGANPPINLLAARTCSHDQPILG